jgi:hypothetical protein
MRTNGVLTLDIGNGHCVYFREEWIEQLRSLPYEEFGVIMRDTIYPALPDQEQKVWNRSQISNRDLQSAIQAFSQ